MPADAPQSVATLTRRSLQMVRWFFWANLAMVALTASAARTSRPAAVGIVGWGVALFFHGRHLEASARLLRMTDTEPPPEWVQSTAWLSIAFGVAIAVGGLTLLLGLWRGAT